MPHEFAHFRLSEMESPVNSGRTSDEDMNRCDIAGDGMKSEPGRPEHTAGTGVARKMVLTETQLSFNFFQTVH